MESTTESYTSNGRLVTLELFLPAGSGPWPLTVLLHGSYGPGGRYRADMISFVEALAEEGIATAMPHYLEGTGSVPGPDLLMQIPGKHLAWRKVCGDALEALAGDARFDRGRVGLVGFSLGGLLALGLTLEQPASASIRAIVAFFAPSRLLTGNFAVMPPTLILHGSDDVVVDPSDSEWLAGELARAGKRKGTDFFHEVYPQQGHGFTGSALDDSRIRTVEFLKERLAGAEGLRTRAGPAAGIGALGLLLIPLVAALGLRGRRKRDVRD